jgi:hypothetical protein
MSEDAKNEYYKQLIEKFQNPNDINNTVPIDDLNLHDPLSSDEEYNVNPGEINIDDYVFASTLEATADNVFKNDINIINILSCYYKQMHNITDNTSLFTGLENIEDLTATNKMMEFIYGEIFRYNASDVLEKDVLYDPNIDIDIDSFKELYCLMIDDEPKFVAKYTLPIMAYLVGEDWLNMNWDIVDLHA